MRPPTSNGPRVLHWRAPVPALEAPWSLRDIYIYACSLAVRWASWFALLHVSILWFVSGGLVMLWPFSSTLTDAVCLHLITLVSICFGSAKNLFEIGYICQP